jgi:hypothetical protein
MELAEPSFEVCEFSSSGLSGSNGFSENDGENEESWEILDR